MLDRETRQAIKEAEKRIRWEAKKRKELVNTEIDYNFLQSLMDKSNNNPDLVITIYFKSGDRMVLQQKYKSDDNTYNDFNGNPTAEEIR